MDTTVVSRSNYKYTARKGDPNATSGKSKDFITTDNIYRGRRKKKILSERPRLGSYFSLTTVECRNVVSSYIDLTAAMITGAGVYPSSKASRAMALDARA